MKVSTVYYRNNLFHCLPGEEWPKEPDWYAHKYWIHHPVAPIPIDGLYEADVKKFKEAIASALDRSIPFEDQGRIGKIAYAKYFQDAPEYEAVSFLGWKEGLYAIPEIEVEIEKICNKGSCAHSGSCYAEGLSFETCAAKSVARIVEPQQPEQPVESQEELWKQVSNEINEEGLWVYEDWDGFKITEKGMKYLQAQFTITRKPT